MKSIPYTFLVPFPLLTPFSYPHCLGPVSWGNLWLPGLFSEGGKKSTIALSICQLVQLLSRIQLFVTAWTAAGQARPPCPSPTPRVYSNSYVYGVGDAIQPSHPLSYPFCQRYTKLHGFYSWMCFVLHWKAGFNNIKITAYLLYPNILVMCGLRNWDWHIYTSVYEVGN